MHIGHVIPRDPQFTSVGDACLIAAVHSATSSNFGLIFFGQKKTKAAINLLEFTVVILQLAAVITIMEEPNLQPSIAAKFPTRMPSFGNFLIRTDNSPSQKRGSQSIIVI
jgi:hypothetical protein